MFNFYRNNNGTFYRTEKVFLTETLVSDVFLTYHNLYSLSKAQQSSHLSPTPRLVSLARFLVSLSMTRLLVSLTRLTALLPHCLLSSLTTHSPTSVLVLPSPLHPFAFLPCLHGGKVGLSGHLYGEVFLDYEILHGQVSLDDELYAGGVASLATDSSIVVGLLHRQVQPDLHSTVGYVVVYDMLQKSILDVTCFMALGIKLDFAVLQRSI
jgi:hypothetical protein